MDIKFTESLLKISPKLLLQLKHVIAENALEEDDTQITFNFRDSSYNTEAGGYHPVEIAMQKDSTADRWSLLYITDFAYAGLHYAELVKELDFDFSVASFCMAFAQPLPITHPSAKEMYQLWEGNFLCYLEYGAYDQIKVSAC